MSDSMPPVYRKGVGIILLNQAGQVFAGARCDMPDMHWQLPQGGIDDGETPPDALMRELKEEIGTDSAKILCESQGWYHYDFPPELAKRCWHGQYAGQMQKWYCLSFLGIDQDINIATQHPEFKDWQWMNFRDLIQKTVLFKRALYQSLAKEFSQYLGGI